MEYNAKEQVLRILRGLGLPADDASVINPYGGQSRESVEIPVHGSTVNVKFTVYGNGGYAAEVTMSLPEDGVLANTFMDHCAAIEKTPKNHGHRYCHGPRWRDWITELRGYKTEAYSPWNNRYLVVESKGYPDDRVDEAVTNVVALARQFFDHLEDLPKLRYWNEDDAEVVAKAKEIAGNADLHETDCDREERAHWLRDRNSFFCGWFYPFNDRGRGTFDVLWPSSVDYAASNMGIKGSFEYAVGSRLLVDPGFIAKARKACCIRKETVEITY